MEVLNSKQIQNFSDQKMNDVDARLKDWIKHNNEHKLTAKRAYFSHDSKTVQNTLDQLNHNLNHGKYASMSDYNAHATISNILDDKRQYANWKHLASANPKMKAIKNDLQTGVMTQQSVFKNPKSLHKYENQEKSRIDKYNTHIKSTELKDMQQIKAHDKDFGQPMFTQVSHFSHEYSQAVLNGNLKRVNLYLDMHPKVCQTLQIMTGKQGNQILKNCHRKPAFYPSNIYHANGKSVGKIVGNAELGNIVDNKMHSYSQQNKYKKSYQSTQESISSGIDKMFGLNVKNDNRKKYILCNRSISR